MATTPKTKQTSPNGDENPPTTTATPAQPQPVDAPADDAGAAESNRIADEAHARYARESLPQEQPAQP